MAYDPDFIAGHSVPMPTLGATALQQAFNGGRPIDHTRFSIVFNAIRGLAFFTAHNIDGGDLIASGTIPRDDRFRLDPLVDNALQIDNDRGYRNNPWDRGHLVRRAALHWGDVDEATRADSESFFWTNIAPQHENLHDDAWGHIEDWLLGRADQANQRVCVFTGPVLTHDDPKHINRPNEQPFQIPAGFWKVLAIIHEQQLKSAGFVVWQRDYDRPDPVDFDPHLEQVRITTLEHLIGISFGALRDVDPLRYVAPPTDVDADVAAPELPAPRVPVVVGGSADIVL